MCQNNEKIQQGTNAVSSGLFGKMHFLTTEPQNGHKLVEIIIFFQFLIILKIFYSTLENVDELKALKRFKRYNWICSTLQGEKFAFLMPQKTTSE